MGSRTRKSFAHRNVPVFGVDCIWSNGLSMKFSPSQSRVGKGSCPEAVGRRTAVSSRRGTGDLADTKGEESMQSGAKSGRMDAVQAHPLAQLLECPAATGHLLNNSAQCISFKGGEVVFRQSAACEGLYLVVSGQFQRRAERLEARVTLGPARPGDLVELAAALGDGRHTFTLSALTSGSVLMLPIDALHQAFESYPPLRMQLLEELAREVSRAYNACLVSRTAKVRRRSSATARTEDSPQPRA